MGMRVNAELYFTQECFVWKLDLGWIIEIVPRKMFNCVVENCIALQIIQMSGQWKLKIWNNALTQVMLDDVWSSHGFDGSSPDYRNVCS